MCVCCKCRFPDHYISSCLYLRLLRLKGSTATTSWDGEAAAGGSVHDTEAVKAKANVDAVGGEEGMVRRIDRGTSSCCIIACFCVDLMVFELLLFGVGVG